VQGSGQPSILLLAPPLLELRLCQQLILQLARQLSVPLLLLPPAEHQAIQQHISVVVENCCA
jgi:hypothetical protein